MDRRYRLTLIVGKTGSGKTTWLRNLLGKSHFLVLDPVGAWGDIREITEVEKILQYKRGQRRITQLLYEAESETIKTVQKLRNVNLIIDDADTFIFYRNKIIYNPFFYAYRHLRMNVFVITHSFQDTPRTILRTADFIVVFDVAQNPYNLYGEKFRPRIFSRDDLTHI